MSAGQYKFDLTMHAYHGVQGIVGCLRVGNDAPLLNVLFDAERLLSPWESELVAERLGKLRIFVPSRKTD